MKKLVLAACVAAAIPVGAASAADGLLKVTGGGQVTADSQTKGPGDTIAFNAQQTAQPAGMMDSAPAKGQLQVNNRSGGTKFHGTVTCIREFTDDQGTMDPADDEDYVRFGGRSKDGTTPFTVDAQDNGSNSTEEDMIFFRTRGATDDPCDDSDPVTQLRSSCLARGNVKVHD